MSPDEYPDRAVDLIDLSSVAPQARDEARRQLRSLLANATVEGPCGGAFVADHEGELVGHVADVKIEVYGAGAVDARHNDTLETSWIGRLEIDTPTADAGDGGRA